MSEFRAEKPLQIFEWGSVEMAVLYEAGQML